MGNRQACVSRSERAVSVDRGLEVSKGFIEPSPVAQNSNFGIASVGC
jgi:hypothetical protein